MTHALTVIGGGKMGEALVRGLVDAGWAAAHDICVVEPVEARRAELAGAIDGLVLVEDLAGAAGGPGIGDVLVAVKPDMVPAVCAALSDHRPVRLVSIAAGVTTAAMEAVLPDTTRVVRVMPNTPAMVGAGMSAVAGGSRIDAGDLDWACGILAAVGEVVVVDEAALDAVTAVSGSGPAYVFLLAEHLTAAGVDAGLDPATADVLTRQTLLGAARLMAASGDEPAQLRRNVTSPNGTTAAALAVFDGRGFGAIVHEAVAAAARRSRELGAS